MRSKAIASQLQSSRAISFEGPWLSAPHAKAICTTQAAGCELRPCSNNDQRSPPGLISSMLHSQAGGDRAHATNFGQHWTAFVRSSSGRGRVLPNLVDMCPHSRGCRLKDTRHGWARLGPPQSSESDEYRSQHRLMRRSNMLKSRAGRAGLGPAGSAPLNAATPRPMVPVACNKVGGDREQHDSATAAGARWCPWSPRGVPMTDDAGDPQNKQDGTWLNKKLQH